MGENPGNNMKNRSLVHMFMKWHSCNLKQPGRWYCILKPNAFRLAESLLYSNLNRDKFSCFPKDQKDNILKVGPLNAHSTPI